MRDKSSFGGGGAESSEMHRRSILTRDTRVTFQRRIRVSTSEDVDSGVIVTSGEESWWIFRGALLAGRAGCEVRKFASGGEEFSDEHPFILRSRRESTVIPAVYYCGVIDRSKRE